MRNQYSWFGIDFGTTNSAASSMTGDLKETASQISYGDNLGRPFPSIVAINKKTGRVITGRDAKVRRNELEGEYKYFSSIKTIIGEDRKYIIAGKEWTPVDIAAEIFKGLKAIIGKQRNCDEAIVAVPIGFTADKKRNLREAARRAGIGIKMFVSEPTAAYCSNYASLRGYSNVAVFDWGGGTLDIAILHIENGKVYELATDGLSIAGDNIDRKMAEKMHLSFCKKAGISKEFDEVDDKSKDLLLEGCENAKIEFSDEEDTVRVTVFKYDGISTLRETMDYSFFSQLIEPEIDLAILCLESAIEKSGLNVANLDCILCVGGSSKLRPLRERLIEEYGEDMLYYPQRVMWDIAKGASMISMSSGHYGLSTPLGLMLSSGEFFELISKGQPLPCRQRTINLATVDNSKQAKFVITDAKDPHRRSFTQNVTVKSLGFLEEQFELSCFIDEDNLFRLRIRSTQFQEIVLHTWTYDRIKVFYELEGNKHGV